MGDSTGLARPLVTEDLDVIRLCCGSLACDLNRRTGQIVRLADAARDDIFVSLQAAPAGLEVFDELDRKWYTDLATPARLDEILVTDRQVTYIKRFEGAPFDLRCTWRPGGDGLRLHVEATLHDDAPQRSIRISVVLPVTPALASWSASWPPVSDVLTEPVRYCYLADEKGKARTGIPMLTLLHPGKGGLTLCMPFDVPKVQLNMGIEPRDPTPWYVPERIPK